MVNKCHKFVISTGPAGQLLVTDLNHFSRIMQFHEENQWFQLSTKSFH